MFHETVSVLMLSPLNMTYNLIVLFLVILSFLVNQYSLIIFLSSRRTSPFPFIVSVELLIPGNQSSRLKYDWESTCDGTILNEKWILTGRYCVTYNNTLYPIRIITGQLKEEEKSWNVMWLVFHPNVSVDLLLIRLRSPLPLARSSSYERVNLIPPEIDYKFEKAVTYQWPHFSYSNTIDHRYSDPKEPDLFYTKPYSSVDLCPDNPSNGLYVRINGKESLYALAHSDRICSPACCYFHLSNYVNWINQIVNRIEEKPLGSLI